MHKPQSTRSARPAMHAVVADAGAMVQQRELPAPDLPLAVAVSRLGGLRQHSQVLAFWIQLRGTARVQATEGSFLLRRGDWMVFDPASRQELQAMRDGLTVGLLLPRGFLLPGEGLLPGVGRARATDVRLALKLWRCCASQLRAGGDVPAALFPLLLHLQSLQAPLHERVDRCPGRTMVRKRQVLARMQRVHMCMEGNAHRNMRLSELAEITRFSEWWVSKTYRAIYDETVQEASLRMRMGRACALLESTGMAISEIGEACGFHDPCSFARLFKRRHGQTASHWRAARQVRRQTGPRQPPDFPAVDRRADA